jgi:hypothetical protein
MGIGCRVGRTVGFLDRVNSAQDIHSMAGPAEEGVGVNTVAVVVRRLPALVIAALDTRAGVLSGMALLMLLLVAVLLLRQRAVKQEACVDKWWC